jgi:hypothetical protein
MKVQPLKTLLLPLALVMSLSLTSRAAILTVSGTNDSGGGSLRECVEVANGNPGGDTIQFNIPGTGVHTIRLLSTLNVTDPVRIEGYSQPKNDGSGGRASPNTLPDGNNAVLLIELDGGGGNFSALSFTAGGSNSSVRGLVINRFPSSPAIVMQTTSNVVEGCFIGTDATGTVALGNGGGVRMFFSPGTRIGGATAAARNIISGNLGIGVQIDVNSTGNLVQGNFIGTDATGTNALANANEGIFINNGAHFSVIGGSSVGARNIIAGNGNASGINAANTSGLIIQGNFIGTDVTGTKLLPVAHGVFLLNGSGLIGGPSVTPGAPPGNVINAANFGITMSANSVVQGNLIGTDATGTRDFGGTADGITIYVSNCTIGGTNAGAGNVISGFAQHGIAFGGGTNNVIQGNRIGTDITGTRPIPNGSFGISLISTRDNVIGPGNVIAFNGRDGINSQSSLEINNRITANSIFGNGSGSLDLGVDLGVNGANANDAGDTDDGPNHLQNCPVLTDVTTSLAGITLQGFLSSAPNTSYTVEFFANDICEASQFCEGQTFIGSTNLTTDASGTNVFSVTYAGAGVSSRFQASATATDPAGNTSEFSACRVSNGADSDGDGSPDLEEVLAGTDPHNPASVLRINAIAVQGGDVRVDWQGGGGRTNMLQTIASLVGNGCHNFVDVPPAVALAGAGDAFTNRTHVGGATNRAGFYRVRLVQ